MCLISTSGSDSAATSAALSQAAAAAGLTSGINIANLASLPPNLNIQNLPATGLNIANLPAISNMQVSLTGGIVPITMINNNTGLLQNQVKTMVTAQRGEKKIHVQELHSHMHAERERVVFLLLFVILALKLF